MTALRVVLPLLCLLAFATSASAECAWVLWNDVTGPPDYEAHISPVSSSDTRQQCEQAMAAKLPRSKAPR